MSGLKRSQLDQVVDGEAIVARHTERKKKHARRSDTLTRRDIASAAEYEAEVLSEAFASSLVEIARESAK